MSIAVQMTGIDKRFGAFQALSGVSLEVQSESIHAVVGENGAGKTTLMRILYGALQSNQGTISLFGQPFSPLNSSAAIRAGIGMVSQHYSIIPELTCLENLILGAEPTALLSRKNIRQRANHLATQMDFSFDWDQPASNLSPSGAQKLEILKLLWRNAKVMILDEPTAMLTPADSELLFAGLRKLVQQGATAIVVTHRIQEVLQHCDDVTVLRNGHVVSTSPINQTNSQQITEWIVGQSLIASPPSPTQTDAVCLEVSNLSDRHHLRDIAFELHEGEILGVAGVDGNGQRELIQALIGIYTAASGSIRFRQQEISKWPIRRRVASGFRLIPENRHEEGLLLTRSLADNTALGIHRLSPLARKRWIDLRARDRFVEEVINQFEVKGAKKTTLAGQLSGGNQQRLVIGRALSLNPKVILAFQPSRGLDITATERFYREVRQRCENGAAAIVVSFDLDELIQRCDRILVMQKGHLLVPQTGREKDRNEIGRLMVGAQ